MEILSVNNISAYKQHSKSFSKQENQEASTNSITHDSVNAQKIVGNYNIAFQALKKTKEKSDEEQCIELLKKAKIKGKKRFSAEDISDLSYYLKPTKNNNVKKSEILKILLDLKAKDKYSDETYVSIDTLIELFNAINTLDDKQSIILTKLTRYTFNNLSGICDPNNDIIDISADLCFPDKNTKYILSKLYYMFPGDIQNSENDENIERIFYQISYHTRQKDTIDNYIEIYKNVIDENLNINEADNLFNNFKLKDKSLICTLLKLPISEVNKLVENCTSSELKRILEAREQKGKFSRNEFELSHKYSSAPAPTFVVIDKFDNKKSNNVLLLNNECITHGDMVSAIITASSQNANIIKYAMDNGDEQVQSLDELKAAYLPFDKFIPRYEEDASPFVVSALTDALTDILDKISHGEKINGLNHSFSYSVPYDQLSKWLEEEITPENIGNKREEILDYIRYKAFFKNNHEFQELYINLSLFNEISKKGVPVYISAGNTNNFEFNLYNLASTYSVAAKSFDDKQTSYSSNNSMTNRIAQSEYYLKRLTDKDGNLIGYSFLDDDIPDVTNAIFNPESRYIEEIEERKFSGGTSAASPRAMVEDYYKQFKKK